MSYFLKLFPANKAAPAGSAPPSDDDPDLVRIGDVLSKLVVIPVGEGGDYSWVEIVMCDRSPMETSPWIRALSTPAGDAMLEQAEDPAAQSSPSASNYKRLPTT